LVEIAQHNLDRVLFMAFEHPGQGGRDTLVAELMSGGANLALLGTQGEVLWLAQRKVGGETANRLALGARYQPPPIRSDRPVGSAISHEDVRGVLESGREVSRALAGLRQGLSPSLVMEALAHLGVAENQLSRLVTETALLASFDSLLARLPNWPPSQEAVERYLQGRHPAGILEQTLSRPPGAAASAAVGAVLRAEQRAQGLEQRRARLEAAVRSAWQRARRKLAERRKELEEAGQGGQWRLAGEMLLAQPEKAPQGSKSVTLDNLYEAGKTVEVKLDPSLSPFENAARYFEKARRAQNAASRLPRLIALAEAEQARLEEALAAVRAAVSAHDLRGLEGEFSRRGWLRTVRGAGERGPKRGLRGVRRFPDVAGYEVLVGTSAEGNETVFRAAKGSDVWLHSRGGKGGHGLVRTRRGEKVPRSVLEQAATLAAYFSEQRHSELVPVDYTERRYVRRPRGAPPGHVVYEREQTLFVRPAEAPALLARLLGERESAE